MNQPEHNQVQSEVEVDVGLRERSEGESGVQRHAAAPSREQGGD